MEAMVLSWAMHQDNSGKLEGIVSDDRWGLTEAEITAFLAAIRPVLTKLADGSRMKQSLAWREDMHQVMCELAHKERHVKVWLYPIA